VILDLSRNILPMELVLLNTASIGQPRRVEDANLVTGLGQFPTLKAAGTHPYIIAAPEVIELGRVGLTLTRRTTSFVGLVKGVEVIIIDVVAAKDIGDEFQD